MEGPQIQQSSSIVQAPPPPAFQPSATPPSMAVGVGAGGVEDDLTRMVVENIVSMASGGSGGGIGGDSSSAGSSAASNQATSQESSNSASSSDPALNNASETGPSTSGLVVAHASNSSVRVKRLGQGSAEKEESSSSVKRPRLQIVADTIPRERLETRLNGILSCTVCFDLPLKAIYQCQNGHLMCIGCLMHILADARLKDETASCPNCRCVISKELCQRNLAVEKAVCELPVKCKYCTDEFSRASIDKHQSSECEERVTSCLYSQIGCPWRGPHHEASSHEESCIHPNKQGRELLDSIRAIESRSQEEQKLYSTVFDLLSLEKINFNDLQLKPYRTDEFIHKLYYETSRFTASNLQWVVKARVNDDQRDPTQSVDRRLSYQLVCKSKLSTPTLMHFCILKGPFGDSKILPRINRFEFNETTNESSYFTLPLLDSSECNKLLASKSINVRLIMFQVLK